PLRLRARPRPTVIPNRCFCALALLAWLVAGCTEQSPKDPEPCPRRGPTFRLGISASGGEGPADVEITVEYGSSTEGFDLKRGNRENQDVCCRAASGTTTKLESVPCARRSDAGVP